MKKYAVRHVHINPEKLFPWYHYEGGGILYSVVTKEEINAYIKNARNPAQAKRDVIEYLNNPFFEPSGLRLYADGTRAKLYNQNRRQAQPDFFASLKKDYNIHAKDIKEMFHASGRTASEWMSGKRRVPVKVWDELQRFSKRLEDQKKETEAFWL